MEMTKSALVKICRSQNLDEYTGLKVLYLEGNGLPRIEGLDTLTQLRSLYLHENLITVIENLDTLTNLDTINLSANMISKVQGLLKLTNLNTLLMANNKLKEVGDIEELTTSPNRISVLDLSNNQLHDGDGVLAVLGRMDHLRVLYLKGNPFIAQLPSYRKTVISRLPGIKYLDDRPVFPDERSVAEAWAKGGLESERAERTRLQRRSENEDKRRMEAFDAMIVAGRGKDVQGEDGEDGEEDLFGEREGDGANEYFGSDDDDGDEYEDCPELEIVGLNVASSS